MLLNGFVQYFDKEGDGEVPYELFLRSIRATMPSQRLALAHEAFDQMGELFTAHQITYPHIGQITI